ncbi:phasin family protein [Sphingomonas parva]|nr:phasin family protein [Sphingomonas parva]
MADENTKIEATVDAATAAPAEASQPAEIAAPQPEPAAAPKAAAPAPKPARRSAPRRKAAPAKASPAPAVARKAAKGGTRTKGPTSASRKPAPKNTAPAAAAAAPAGAKTTIQTRFTNEGTKTMFNDTNNVAERVQAVFGDVNERAKNTIERNTRIAEELTELGRGNVEALVASTKVAARGVETIGQEVAEFGRKSFEDASAALKSLAEVKSPTDFFRLQGEFARSQFDALVAESSKLSETVIKLAGEVAEPITNRATVAAERVRTAVAL